MAEFELFSHVLLNNGETDSLFVSLKCERDIGVRSIKPIRLEIHEAFSSISPTVTFTFVDGYGDLMNHNKPNPMDKYFLDFGRGVLSLSRLELRIVGVSLVTKKAGSTEQVQYQMIFSHAGWTEMTSVRRNRSWLNAKHSDVVKDIVKDIGFTRVDVPDTPSGDEYTIQPYWDNLTMLSHLRSLAASSNGGHVEFGTTMSGEFFFKGIGDLINEQRVAAIKREIPVIRMEGQIPDEAIRAEEYEKNKGIPTYFSGVGSTEWYSEAVSSGAGGVKSVYYDYDTDTIKVKHVKYSDTNNPQLSDWAGIQKAHESSGKLVYGGRYGRSHDVAENAVVDIVDSMNINNITTEGSIFYKIGKMVELIIPVPPNAESIVPSNIMYSGFYLISELTHIIQFNDSKFNTSITLMREGFDGKDLEGYATSKRGKFVG